MLGLGWTEMLVIGIVALIVIGPKDLPVVMNRIGKVAGQIRRMGTEFQREINKTTGLDEVRNLRTSITAPLQKTAEEIRKEFNTMTPGGPKPSGVIKPADPAAESVVDEIKAAAGMAPAKTADQIAAESGFKPAGPPPVAPKTTLSTDAAKPEPVKAAVRKAPAKSAPAKATAAPAVPQAEPKAPAAAKKTAEPKVAAVAGKPARKRAPKAETTPEVTDTQPAKPTRKRAPSKAKPADAPADAGNT